MRQDWRVEHDTYQNLMNCSSLHQLREQTHGFVRALGFDGFLYLTLVGTTEPGVDPEVFVLSSYAQAFIDHYQQHHCYRFDPAAVHIRQHQTPTHWGRSSFVGTRAEPMYRTASRFGIRSGATFPVTPPAVTIAGFGYARDQELEQSLPDIRRTMPFGQLLATYVHQAVARLLAQRQAPLAPTVTERERECLSLSAQGLKDSEIADLLGVSVRTVLFHLGNVRRKLEADNRAQMVARAMALKVIGL